MTRRGITYLSHFAGWCELKEWRALVVIASIGKLEVFVEPENHVKALSKRGLVYYDVFLSSPRHANS